MTAEQRRIVYLSGTRADFGLMQATLQAIHEDPCLDLQVVVTGMHLSEHFGMTVREIEAAGLQVAIRIPVNIEEPTGAAMARNLALTLSGCVDAFQLLKPDVVMLLGDRGEMLAGALAAIHLGVPIVHIHGGERSGTVDEPVRHAISKLSHFHFVATKDARDRLIRMGEREDCIVVTGAPGLVGLTELANIDREALCRKAGFDSHRRIALFVYHPVLQEAETAGQEAGALLDTALEQGLQVMALMPNSDAGSEQVRQALNKRSSHSQLRLATHLTRSEFVSWMANCDVMLGNSSSGIIEAASLGTPVVNVGSRQNLRERNSNVIDTEADRLPMALNCALSLSKKDKVNLYGDGTAASRIVATLKNLDLKSRNLLLKANAY